MMQRKYHWQQIFGTAHMRHRHRIWRDLRTLHPEIGEKSPIGREWLQSGCWTPKTNRIKTYIRRTESREWNWKYVIRYYMMKYKPARSTQDAGLCFYLARLEAKKISHLSLLQTWALIRRTIIQKVMVLTYQLSSWFLLLKIGTQTDRNLEIRSFPKSQDQSLQPFSINHQHCSL